MGTEGAQRLVKRCRGREERGKRDRGKKGRKRGRERKQVEEMKKGNDSKLPEEDKDTCWALLSVDGCSGARLGSVLGGPAAACTDRKLGGGGADNWGGGEDSVTVSDLQ